jgi:hypothetical protein
MSQRHRSRLQAGLGDGEEEEKGMKGGGGYLGKANVRGGRDFPWKGRAVVSPNHDRRHFPRTHPITSPIP